MSDRFKHLATGAFLIAVFAVAFGISAGLVVNARQAEIPAYDPNTDYCRGITDAVNAGWGFAPDELAAADAECVAVIEGGTLRPDFRGPSSPLPEVD